MTLLGPLTFEPVLVVKPWGGRRLEKLGRQLPDGVLVGESWDVADLESVSSMLVEAPGRHHDALGSTTLRDLVSTHGGQLLGEVASTSWGGFPLLVKHLDAGQHLSVQVHPPQVVAAKYAGAHAKSEAWVVVEAEPGAELFIGVREGVDLAQLSQAFGTPAIVDLLRRRPARVGDVHDIPAGLVHALSAGVVVAEPQTPSDTTYRLYDWTQEYGRAPRDLHRDQALTSLQAEWGLNLDPPPVRTDDGVLVRSDTFTLRRSRVRQTCTIQVDPRRGPRTIVVLTGEIGMPGGRSLGSGGVAVLPAAWSGPLEARHTSSWVEVDLVP